MKSNQTCLWRRPFAILAGCILAWPVGAQNLADVAEPVAEDVAVTSQAVRIAKRLLSAQSCWSSFDRLTNDFQHTQQDILPIGPPSPNYVFYAERDRLQVFDPAGFPSALLKSLVPEPYHDMVYVYRITVSEDPVTRERVIYNGKGDEIYRLDAPVNYDPLAYLRKIQPGALEQDTAAARELRGIYDPSRVLCEYLLMPAESVAAYAMLRAVEASEDSLLSADRSQTMMTSLFTPAADDFVITDLIATGGIVNLEIHLPEATTSRVDVFYIDGLPGFPWTLATSTPATAGTFRVQFACTLSNALVTVGNADIDTDGDGIPDDRELLLYGSDPTKGDTDGDGINDYAEIFTYGTDPTKWDSDGDGMSDGWEVANGHNPLDPNDPPNVSGTIFYSGRQTGAVWVVAVTSSNSWGTNNAVLLSGPGAYLIPNLTGTNYYLKAWRDSSSNAVLGATEAFGVYVNNPVCITNQVRGIDITLVDPDTDSDGLPDWWEIAYFGSITNWVGASDPDGDQYTNLEEYNAGTDPTDAASHPWTISGTIAYSGPQTGTIHVIASGSASGWTAVGGVTISAPGSYTIPHLPPNSNYWVKAWRDSAGSGYLFWEAQGRCTNNPIFLGTNVVSADVTLGDPDSDSDGLPDWWEVMYGLDPHRPGIPNGAWWRMDEGSGSVLQDSSGNSNTGTISNQSGTAWTGGVMDNALRFDGATQFVQITNSVSLNPTYVSVSLWVNAARDMTNGSAVFFSKKQSTGSTGYELSYNAGALSFLVCVSGARTVSVPFTLSGGVWHHVTGTYGGTQQCLYVDGILQVSTNYSWGTSFGYIDQGTTSARLGASADATPSDFFAGVMDDVRVYGHDLTSNEVHAVFELGADPDGDGVSNWQEYQLGTDPTNWDTDGDGMSDGDEVVGRDILIAWGEGWNGECQVPVGMTNVVQISAGGYHSLALLSDGHVIGWGDNSWGQLNVPPDVTNVVAISAGGGEKTGLPNPDDGGHSMAILADGHVRCWGWDGENECEGWIAPLNEPSVGMPSAVSTGHVIAVAAGGFHSVALLSNSTVWVWGYNGSAEVSSMPNGLSNVVSIAAGESFSMALKNDGSMVCWGANYTGQTNTPSDLATGTVVQAIAAGANHAMALLRNGTVRCWGSDDGGQTNVPSDVTNAIAIAAGSHHSMAILADGRLVCWGSNNVGQCDVPVDATNVLAIAANGSHNVAVIHVRTDPRVPDVRRGGLAEDLWDYTSGVNPAYPYPTNRNVTIASPNALNLDSDGDGLSNAMEASIGSGQYSAFTNGMSQGWLWAHFGTLSVDPNADPDGDGVSNLQEYLLGTDPNVANPVDPQGVVGLDVFTPLEK